MGEQSYNLWWLYFIVVGVALVLSAFCSAADMVYGVVDQDRLQKEADQGDKKALRALRIAKDFELSISTILFANNIGNVVGSSFVTLLGLAWLHHSNQINFGQEILATAIFTVVVIIFCEFLPKAIAKRFSLKLAKSFAIPVTIMKYISIIFVWPISKFFKLVGKLFIKKAKEEDEIDEEVLNEMVDTMEENEQLDEEEAELVRSAIDFNDIQAFEIMTPRVDVFAIDVEDDIEEIFKEGEIFSHSRIPVYEDTVDNIIGIISIKTLLKARLKGETIDLKSMSIKPLYIPRNHQIMDLLAEFKREKIHIAVVKDEYGGTEGIVTMEDILEEIVGDIFDEQDKIEEEIIDVEENTWVVNGMMNIDDFFDYVGYEEEVETDYATIGGFCQEILDRFAVKDDEFDYDIFHFRVLEADEFTVEKLLITKKAVEEE